MDTKHLTAGVRLCLPVYTQGALFSLGDGHAAQGDGEICGTAIETPTRVLVQLTVPKDVHVTKPTHDRLPGREHESANQKRNEESLA